MCNEREQLHPQMLGVEWLACELRPTAGSLLLRCLRLRLLPR